MRGSIDSYKEEVKYRYQNQYLGMILETIRDDCTTYEIYQKISSIIPAGFIVERQPIAGSEEMFGFLRYYIKRKLDTQADKDIIEKLKAFAHYQNINGNQLTIKNNLNNCFVHTIYKSN